MEPNKPLNTEEKLELEMDKVIEMEQQPMSFKNNSKFFKGFFIAILIGLIILGIYLYFQPKKYFLGDATTYDRYKCFGFVISDPGGGPVAVCYGYLSVTK